VLHQQREEGAGGDEQADGAVDAAPAASLTLVYPAKEKGKLYVIFTGEITSKASTGL
jgi:hypothetical protein